MADFDLFPPFFFDDSDSDILVKNLSSDDSDSDIAVEKLKDVYLYVCCPPIGSPASPTKDLHVYSENKMLIIRHDSKGDPQVFDVPHDKAPTPARLQTMAAASESSIFVLGGTTFKHIFDTDGEDYNLADFYQIDVHDKNPGFEQLPPCKHLMRRQGRALLFDQKLYVIGGDYDPDSIPFWGIVYDFNSEKWCSHWNFFELELPGVAHAWVVPARLGSQRTQLLVYSSPCQALHLYDPDADSLNLYDDSFGGDCENCVSLFHRGIIYFSNGLTNSFSSYHYSRKKWLHGSIEGIPSEYLPHPECRHVPDLNIVAVAPQTLCLLSANSQGVDAFHTLLNYVSFCPTIIYEGDKISIEAHAVCCKKIRIQAFALLNCLTLSDGGESQGGDEQSSQLEEGEGSRNREDISTDVLGSSGPCIKGLGKAWKARKRNPSSSKAALGKEINTLKGQLERTDGVQKRQPELIAALNQELEAFKHKLKNTEQQVEAIAALNQQLEASKTKWENTEREVQEIKDMLLGKTESSKRLRIS